jgi:hypothetical protein
MTPEEMKEELVSGFNHEADEILSIVVASIKTARASS